MKNFFVPVTPNTPDSSNNYFPDNLPFDTNEVADYFNEGKATQFNHQRSAPQPFTRDHSSFFSDGLFFKRLDGNTCEVVGVQKQLLSPSCIVVPAITSYGHTRVIAIANAAFKNLPVREMVLPSTITKIGDSAFEGSGIETFTYAGELTAIGKRAFAGCARLHTVDISKCAAVDIIPEECFKDSSLQRLILPDTIVTIGDGAFRNNHSLENFEIPGSVESIGAFAFGECTNLKNLKIDGAHTVVATSAFEGCKNLSNLQVNPKNSFVYNNAARLFMDSPKLLKQEGDCFLLLHTLVAVAPRSHFIVVPDSVDIIGPYAFQHAEPNPTIWLSNPCLKVLLPNALARKGTGTVYEDGVLRESKEVLLHDVTIHLCPSYSLLEWNKVHRIRSDEPSRYILSYFSDSQNVQVIEEL